MQNRKEIVMINVANIYPHPDNPRKDVGDVTELAESIKKQGVMQNLTVIPLPALTEEPEEQPDADIESLSSDFHVIIGHRRLAAAKLAGIEKVPCKIVSKISKKEQVSIMLEENMQREDLTVWEQAQGFQMMIDLGETEDTIADKTGFSKTTIKHRLNIAKLDQDELKNKEQDKNFQLSLKDLYELEKIEDVEERNKILREATDNRNLVYRVHSHVEQKERDKKADAIVKMLKELGVVEAPKQYASEQYRNKWETVKNFLLNDEVPESIRIKNKKDEKLYYYAIWYEIRVVRKKKTVKKKLTPAEQKEKEQKANKKYMKDVLKKLDERRRLFVMDIVEGRIAPIKDEEKVKDALWSALVLNQSYLAPSQLSRFFTKQPLYACTKEEKKEASQKAAKLSILQQMLVMLNVVMNETELVKYNGTYYKENGQALMDGYKVLRLYGWSFEDEEEEKVVDGSHEFYEEESGT
jgi:ParB family chromosome partitioning protein